MSHVTCHMSGVTCHVLSVSHQVSTVKIYLYIFFFYKVMELVIGGSGIKAHPVYLLEVINTFSGCS